MKFDVSVVGLPRSGTTWVGKIFDSHPDVLYFHEPDYVDRIPCVPYVAKPADIEVWRSYLEAWQIKISHRGSRRTFGKRPSFRKSYLGGTPGKLKKAAYDFRINLIALSERLGLPERSIPTSKIYDRAKFRVWKSVESLGRLPVFAHAFPKQQFLHVIRHPCGFVNSVIRGDQQGKFGKSVAMASDNGLLWWALQWSDELGISISLEELVRSPAPVRLAWYWRLMNEGVVKAVSESNNYRVMRYDDLCTNTVEYSREVFASAGISWGEQTAAFVEPKSEGGSDEYFSVNKNSVAAANAWQSRMSTQDIDSVLEVAGAAWEGLSPSTQVLSRPHA